MSDLRARYLADSVATASPARLLTLLYDRLLLDLHRATSALETGDRGGAGTHLAHAQDIVCELIATLDVSAWEGGNRLMSLYGWVLNELLTAGTTGDAARVEACRGVVAPLADAWHQAADALAGAERPAAEPVAATGLLGVA